SATRKKHLIGLVSLMLEMTNRGHKPDPEEQQELAATLLELLSPEALSAVADLEEGVPPQARRKLDRWRKMVGKAIRIHRIQRNWTQADLAGRTGLPQSHVSR